eukprot:scaffold11779_cov31-Phaeocystis_antarctica.AAC.2
MWPSPSRRCTRCRPSTSTATSPSRSLRAAPPPLARSCSACRSAPTPRAPACHPMCSCLQP